MLFLFWLIIRAFAGLLVLQGSGDGANLKILVLRQQLRVLRRKTGRPPIDPEVAALILRMARETLAGAASGSPGSSASSASG